MTPQDQEFIYIPNQQYGDCQRACIASVLDLPIADVPHFLRDADGCPSKFWNSIYDFCEARGFDYLPHQPGFDAEAAAHMGGFHIIGGPSPRGGGILHAVVGKDGSVYFDPHPSKEGILGPVSDWTYDYFIPMEKA